MFFHSAIAFAVPLALIAADTQLGVAGISM